MEARDAEQPRGVGDLRIAIRRRREVEQCARTIVARERIGGAPEVGLVHVALDVADLHVGDRELTLDVRVALRIAREPIEILACARDDELACLVRARQIADLRVDLEQQRAREPAHLAEPPLRAARLIIGPARLRDREHGGAGKRDRRERRRDQLAAVAPDQLACAIAERRGPRGDRKTSEMAADVLGELLDRRVTARRILVERLEHDVVEIAGECRAIGLRCDRAGPRGLVVADPAQELLRIGRATQRRHLAQQLVEHRTE